MKFNLAWAKMAQENSILKTALLVLGATCTFFAICMTQLALKSPLVIERECFSKAAPLGSAKHTNVEIESFVEMALSQRFDTKDPGREVFLSTSERELRAKEQKDLLARKLVQRVVVGSVVVEDAGIKVDADRLITVGEIRSAFKFPLVVKVESVSRTTANPYGLVLSDVKPIEQKVKQ